MKRIDSATATLDDKFTDGNPLLGIPATNINEDWLNGVQEEIITLIEFAGLTPSGADLTQLRQAITSIAGAAVPDASTTVKGKVELATNAETTTGTDTVRAVTPAGVKAAIDALIAAAPGALDTLDELAAALGDDANFASTVTTALAGKQALDATLTALAGLATGADKLAYSTGTDTFAQTDFPAFARTLVAAVDAPAARAVIGAGNLVENLIINGEFSVKQRGASSFADAAYSIDRWKVLCASGNLTVAQQTDQENGTPFNVRLTQPDASPKQFGLIQYIEGKNCKGLRGQSIAASARVRCSAATTIRYAILRWTGTEDSLTSDPISSWAATPTYVANFTAEVAGAHTVSANTWTDLNAITAAMNSGANNLAFFIWTDSAQAQNVTLDIARAVVNQGTLPIWNPRTISDNLNACLRYFEQSAPTVERIATDTTAGYGSTVWADYKAVKRATPTITTTNGPGAVGTQVKYTNTTDMAQRAGSSNGDYAAFTDFVADAEL